MPAIIRVRQKTLRMLKNGYQVSPVVRKYGSRARRGARLGSGLRRNACRASREAEARFLRVIPEWITGMAVAHAR